MGLRGPKPKSVKPKPLPAHPLGDPPEWLHDYAKAEWRRVVVLNVTLRIDDSVKQITWLLQKYSNVPMSLADACLVRISELYTDSHVLTLDSDFRIYRKNKRQVIRVLSPSDL